MIIKLLLDSDVPLYQQLKDKIIYAIATGEAKEGEQLPSVRQLSSSLSINLHTVNKAYTQLSIEGFVTILKGRGVLVNTKDMYAASDNDRKKIFEQIQTICAEAKCRSLDVDEIINMCSKAYATLKGD